MLDFAVIAAPLTLAALALLFFGRRHIYRQMDDIAAAANARRDLRNHADKCSCNSPATLLSNAHDQHAAQQRAMHLGAATSSPEGTEYRFAEPKQMVSISVCEVKMESV